MNQKKHKPGAGGHNKKYDENSRCEYEDCESRPTVNNKCAAHYYQNRRYGYMWPVGTPNPNKKKKEYPEGRKTNMGTQYNSQRTCDVCGKTKEWNRFCLGAEHLKDTCRDCHRAMLSEQALGSTEQPLRRAKTNKAMSDLLEYIDGLTGRSSESNEVAGVAVD